MPPSRSGTFVLSSLLLGFLLAVPTEAAEGEPAEELPSQYRSWLESVHPLLSDTELTAFLELHKDYQRDAFIERFWAVRDPFPQTARNEFRDRWEHKVELARAQFEDLEGERPRYFLLIGPPDSITRSTCELLPAVEIWYYDGAERIRGDFFLIFVSAAGGRGGRYRLWHPAEGLVSLLLWNRGVATTNAEAAQVISRECIRGDEILGAASLSLDWERMEAKQDLIPRPNEEWVESFLAFTTDLPEGAAGLAASMEVRYPGRYQSRTVVQAQIAVPQDEATVSALGNQRGYNFLIDGEVLRRGKLFENFRYKFDIPEQEVVESQIPLIVERYLRPGRYTLIVRVRDLGSEKYFRTSRQVQVPNLRLVTPPKETVPTLDEFPSQSAATPPADLVAPSAVAEALLMEANASITESDTTLKLLTPAGRLITGKVRVEAVASGEGISRVSFRLNDKPILRKTRPPYSVELDLGQAPRFHKLTAVAFGEDGTELARDEVVLNSGPHRFSVRLLEPQRGRRYARSLRAQAEVEVPEGETLDRLELYLNDTLVASLYQPPFVQPILLPPRQDITYVRAVGYLVDGGSSEDLVFVNSDGFLEEVRVNFVELYTSVLDSKGRPRDGMRSEDFLVIEDGIEQEIRRFELVGNLSIHAGILLDTSTSMDRVLKEAERAALRFFEQVLTPKDRAAVITFNDRPSLAVRFTNSLEVLAGGLAGLVSEGETTLYDSLVYSLYYFSGIRGKRAIVVLSDGQDSRSRYSFEDAIEFARRTGVAIYFIGLNVPISEGEVRYRINRLSEETGGRSFYIDGIAGLEAVYDRIQEELRSQYLIAYQSSNDTDADRFRVVELKVLQPGLEAKTMRGYYP